MGIVRYRLYGPVTQSSPIRDAYDGSGTEIWTNWQQCHSLENNQEMLGDAGN